MTPTDHRALLSRAQELGVDVSRFRVQTLLLDGLLHADSSDACLDFLDASGGRARTVTLDELLTAMCPDCYQRRGFDVHTDDPALWLPRRLDEMLVQLRFLVRTTPTAEELDALFKDATVMDVTAHLGTLTENLADFLSADAVDDGKDPVRLAVLRGSPLLTPALQVALGAMHERYRTLLASDATGNFLRDQCAALLSPRNFLHSDHKGLRQTVDHVRDVVTQALLENNDLVLMDLKEVEMRSFSRESVEYTAILRHVRSSKLAVVPLVVFEAIAQEVTIEQFVVLSEPATVEHLEALDTLYQPESDGPFGDLEAALAAVRAL